MVVSKVRNIKNKEIQSGVACIPIIDDKKILRGELYPVTINYHDEIPDCISLFSNWRKENPTLSPSVFQITDERTEAWMKKAVIENDNRIIFMVRDNEGEFLGHIGFAGFRFDTKTAEVDSVLRGVKGKTPRIMEFALLSLVEWGKKELGLEHIDLEVISDNYHAINFYKRCGFVEDQLIPLKKVILQDEVKWVACQELKNAEKYYLHMILC